MERAVLIERIGALRAELDAARAQGRTVGFVPTMGAFHDGHRSLMRAARAHHDTVVVSLFVNPLQFGPAEDLDRYPRDLAGDRAVAAAEGVDIVFAPPVEEMYTGFPAPPLTTVSVAGLTDGLCGSARPGHFDGVATVVTKLFGIVGPSTAYFGKKDAQQLAVVRRLAADLCLPVEVVGCPLVREADGLAMSSRNRNLSPAQREAATVIHRGLRAGAELVVAGGERDAGRLRRVVANVLTTEELVRLEYAEVVAADTLAPLDVLDGDVLVAVAARVGDVRLIDNMTIHVDARGAVVDLGVAVAPTEEGLCAAR
ncbi:MAG TPA: pantoate--beta-alanine ligase [Acidimicrobiia bacterium]|nr:pantoate--beta-alanine ligase [Acidimicrobiia bacterium]